MAKVEQLTANNQPDNWFDTVTNECKNYPINHIDISEGELIIDIGANVGGFWNAWKHKWKNWHLVEPSFYNVQQIFKNGYDGSVSHNAVSDKSGKVLKLMKYWADDNDTLSGNFGTSEYVNETNGHGWKGDYEEVVSLCLEDIQKGREIGLLKVDCEGAEYDLLMNKDLKDIKYIVMEMHNFLGGVKQKKLMTWIENTHTEEFSDGDGVNSHYIKLWKRK
jgi:FkbM family methyltransferase